jgi:uncharacterized protein (TIGR03083 family)
MADLGGIIRSERLALIDFLDSLSPDEWATPSLCDGWTVQDVAAHLAVAPSAAPHAAFVALARGGFRLNRMIADMAVRYASRGPGPILDQLRINAETGAQPFGLPKQAPLTDALVHGLDIRRPLGASRVVTGEAFAPAADWLAGQRWPLTVPLGGKVRKTVAGLRLVAGDVGWSHGEGPEVRCSAEAILLLLTGRAVGRTELTGPGAAELHSRF